MLASYRASAARSQPRPAILRRRNPRQHTYVSTQNNDPALRNANPGSIHMSKRASKTAACMTCLLPHRPPVGAAPLITATFGKLGRRMGICFRQHMRRPQTVPPVAALCSRLTGRTPQDRSTRPAALRRRKPPAAYICQSAPQKRRHAGPVCSRVVRPPALRRQSRPRPANSGAAWAYTFGGM